MLSVYVTAYGGSPNVYKIRLLLEEASLPHELVRVDTSAGEQFSPEFLKISPNNKVPAIVDHDPADGGGPLSIFESASIMIYLADKAGQFIPPVSDVRARSEVVSWLVWQVANLGPYMGQMFHFKVYAPEKLPYAITRYTNEVGRLYGVMERRLSQQSWLGSEDYSIADMASFALTSEWRRTGHDFSKFPRLLEWRDRIEARPAYARAYAEQDYSKAEIGGASLFEKGTWQRLFLQTEDTIADYQAQHATTGTSKGEPDAQA
jgi:GST-like protein